MKCEHFETQKLKHVLFEKNGEEEDEDQRKRETPAPFGGGGPILAWIETHMLLAVGMGE